MNKVQFVTELSKLRSSSTFLTVAGYRNEYSEVADYSLVFHMNYKTALERSIATLQGLSLTSVLETQARDELLAGFHRSLHKAKESPIEEREDAYQHFLDEDGNYIKGVKLHTKTSTLHLYGLVVHKRVIMPGVYPVRDERPLAEAKRHLRYLTSVGKFRQFKILPSQVDHISVENLTLLPPSN
jgi:hypothetical protein